MQGTMALTAVSTMYSSNCIAAFLARDRLCVCTSVLNKVGHIQAVIGFQLSLSSVLQKLRLCSVCVLSVCTATSQPELIVANMHWQL